MLKTIGGLLLLTAISAHADFSLALSKSSSVTAQNREKLTAFLNEVTAKLPEKIKTTIDREIQVKFVDMGRDTVSVPVCGADTENTDEKTEENNDAPEYHGPEYLGQVRSFGPVRSHVVRITRAFIPEILLGAELSRQYDCGHRSLYRLAVATLVHELAHMYDWETKVSKDEHYLKLLHFVRKRGVGSMLLTGGLVPGPYKSKNMLWTRSPDPYEFKNRKESFAVNFEYFALDPEFHCRRPAVNAYMSQIFGEVFAADTCKLNTIVYLNSREPNLDMKLPINIDPSRVYRIDYLFASKGKAIMSRWGHAMYRLVVCAPERKEVGPDCLHDVAYHVAISYRANVNDIMISYWKGIIGKYPSQMFLIPFREVLVEYNKEELRDLLSLPLNLTDNEQ